MYCIETEALVSMFNEGSSDGFTFHLIFTRICMALRAFAPFVPEHTLIKQ